jgi:DNA-binding response OmpR family regulator
MMAAAAATAVKLLLVEDDPDAGEAISRVLRKSGFEVEWCSSAGAALDLKLPDANGALFLRRVRRENLPVKVAVVTAYADAAAHPALQRFPPDRVFTKPLDFGEFLEWVERVA